TVGSFAAFMAALGQIFDPVKRLTKIASSMQRMLTAAESVFTLVDNEPEADDGTREFEGPIEGRIEFRNVGHRFEGGRANVLEDINLVVEPGSTVAFVGRSGSGKTTLVNTIPRFV